MSGDHRTPYAEDALRVESGTQPEDIRDFVRRRASNPHQIGDLTVWNFNNHTLNEEALREQAEHLLYDEFLIPFQASGVWGYMVTILPEELREVEILTYQQDRGRYVPYPNYIRHSGEEENERLREDLSQVLDDERV